MKNLAVLLTGACALQMPALQVPWKRAARSRQVEKSSTAVAGDTVLKHGLEVAMLKTVPPRRRSFFPESRRLASRTAPLMRRVNTQVLTGSAVDENGNRISRTKQAKQLFKRYGAAYLTTSITLSLISYALCWSAVANGLDIVSLLRRLGLSAVVSPTAGVGTIAYVAHKAASPIRFPPTVALTPVVSRKLFGRAL